MSLAAIWTGLLYSQVSLDASHDIISKWTFEDIIHLDIALNSEGFDAKFRNYKVSELLSELLDLSKDGLKDRSVINSKNQLEDIYLEELFEIIKNKKTPAHYLIDQYSKLWSRDILNIYRNFNS
jgi:glutamate--cysteine ligase